MIVPLDAVARLDAELAAAASATAVLQRRCPHAAIRAVVDRSRRRAPSTDQRERLAVARGEPVAYRRVRLMCGTRVLSLAENWYVPARLTREMNAALAGDAPFGAVIRPLSPWRRMLSREPLGARGRIVLRHRALVLSGAGTPLAEVAENYTMESVSGAAAIPDTPGGSRTPAHPDAPPRSAAPAPGSRPSSRR